MNPKNARKLVTPENFPKEEQTIPWTDFLGRRNLIFHLPDILASPREISKSVALWYETIPDNSDIFSVRCTDLPTYHIGAFNMSNCVNCGCPNSNISNELWLKGQNQPMARIHNSRITSCNEDKILILQVNGSLSCCRVCYRLWMRIHVK